MIADFFEKEYIFNDEDSIWTRQNFEGILYSDGDEVEQRIESIVKNTKDLSVLSDELRPHCTDWPSTYHLSATRANILRPFEKNLKGDILEIGAGCGAITRYLGECGAQVLALEGTLRRASIARARTRDLNNVTVVSDKFDNFKYKNKFDIVTLIGVLEYANLFTDGENPVALMLERAKSFLKPNGKLFIAIENQLGLKYFASAPEDHVGIPMYGVEGWYRKDQPQTYGRKHLHYLVETAGFSSIEFLAPFPDYKLPVSIVTESGFSCDEFDSAALASQSIRKDPQLPKIMAFSTQLVWPSIVDNGLSMDLSNSFLIVAAPRENQELVEPNNLAWHFTSERRKTLCKLTTFVKNSNGEIDVFYKRLDRKKENPVIDRLLNNCLPENDQYRVGEILSNDLNRIICKDGWKVEEVSYFLNIWLNYLSQINRKKSQALDLPKQATLFPGELFDYIPQNIIRANDGTLHVIDKEWVFNDKIEIEFLLFRVLWSVIHSTFKFGRPANSEIKTYFDFIHHCMKALGWIISDKNFTKCIDLEYRIQSEVAGRSIDSSGVMSWLKKESIPVENLSQAVGERDSQITSLSQAVGERDSQITSLSQAVGERDSQITSLSQAVGERESQIAGLIQAVGERETQITSLIQAMGERDTQITSLSQVLGDREIQITNLSQVLEENGTLITSLGQAAVERESQIACISQEVEERGSQITNLKAKLKNAIAVANQMIQTRSWRLTRPLRIVARLARYGLTNEDNKVIRMYFHRLPLPAPAKRLVSFFYHKRVVKGTSAMRSSARQISQSNSTLVQASEKLDSVPDYIVWGVIDWHFRHQRPQQLAVALASTGRRVFYITPNFTDNERAGFEPEALDEGGLLFQVKLFVKGAPVIYSAAPSVETLYQLSASIGEMLQWANSAQIISLVDHPFWNEVASVLPNSRMIYDCMDHHEGFGNNDESLVQLEKSLLKNAVLTITTSSWLDEAVAPNAKRRALIRNAADYMYFSKKPRNVYLHPQGRRIIGYYGAIAEWCDLSLVEAVARQHPECCVLLIGADTVNARVRLSKLSNVTFTGEVPYSQLTHYLYSFDVCLLPFKVIPLTLATNPVKVYEYLSAGKPVVAIDLPEMLQFEGLVYAAANKEGFLSAVSKVLSQPEPNALVQQRKIFAQGQTWQHRAEDLVQQAESAAFDPKVSVVVVTYNNLEFTRACLESLETYSQYENIEIIVVDNASIDGSPAFLSEWFAGKNNRKLILNEDNRGFAAANNQGLKIATGAYLVLLNNDTYVTPGWIRTLVRHLERDKTIGLIGPVTNNIGNEARIDIAYSNMNEMLQNSAVYTRRHVGKIFSLRTTAFFCVMMPRTTYARVGSLDEVYGLGFFEDDDYCRRIEQLGLRIVCAEDVFVHHHLSASFNKLKSQDRQKLFDGNKAIYEAKWGEWVPHSYSKTKPVPEQDP